jgi:hypothetical protein
MEYVIFQMLTVMAIWIQKSPGYELSVFLSSSPPTTHNFFTDSSLSYLHQALHFLSSHYNVSPSSFLPSFTSFIITFPLFIFSFFIHVSRIIWGTKCGTYRLSIKEDVVVANRLLLRLQKLWNVRYVMKSYSRIFQSIVV